jgi:hypothetical protein
LIFAMLVSLVLYWPASHHVVRTAEGVIVLSKRFLTYHDTYVDVRRWSSRDYDAHPALKRALIEQGYRDLLVELKTREIAAGFDRMKAQVQALAEEITAKIERTVDIWLGDAGESNTAPQSIPAVQEQ